MIKTIILANILVKRNNKYLLVQEATDKIYGSINTHSKGKWTFPHGHVDAGETIEQAAKRELLEETGGTCKTLKLVGIAQVVVDNSLTLLSFIFRAHHFRQTVPNWSHEISRLDWFTLKDIIKLENQGLNRDQVPLSKIITTVQSSSSVKFIDWPQPDYLVEVFRLLSQEKVVRTVSL